HSEQDPLGRRAPDSVPGLVYSALPRARASLAGRWRSRPQTPAERRRLRSLIVRGRSPHFVLVPENSLLYTAALSGVRAVASARTRVDAQRSCGRGETGRRARFRFW